MAVLAVLAAIVILPVAGAAWLGRRVAPPAWHVRGLGIRTVPPPVPEAGTGVRQVVECEKCDREYVYCLYDGHKLSIAPVVNNREHPPRAACGTSARPGTH